MFTPYTRHLILLFVAGLTWGYVIKTIVGKNYYIGWGDPSVITHTTQIDLNALTPHYQVTQETTASH